MNMLLLITPISLFALIGVCRPVGAAAAQVSSSQPQIDTLLDCLHRNIANSSIITPANANFVNDSIRWTTLGAPSYSVLVNSGSEEDIATSVRNTRLDSYVASQFMTSYALARTSFGLFDY
jgi:hypothetical protein